MKIKKVTKKFKEKIRKLTNANSDPIARIKKGACRRCLQMPMSKFDRELLVWLVDQYKGMFGVRKGNCHLCGAPLFKKAMWYMV